MAIVADRYTSVKHEVVNTVDIVLTAVKLSTAFAVIMPSQLFKYFDP